MKHPGLYIFFRMNIYQGITSFGVILWWGAYANAYVANDTELVSRLRD